MAPTTKIKRSSVGIDLVRQLAQEGDRIFTTARARELAPQVGLSNAYVGEALYHPAPQWLDHIPASRSLCPVLHGAGRRAGATSSRSPWRWSNPPRFPTGRR